MRRILPFAAAALLAFPGIAAYGQSDKPADQTAQSAPQPSSAQAPAPPANSLAEAARKTRAQKKEAAKPAKVFTNDNLPTEGGVSTIGAAAPAQGGQPEAQAGAKPAPKDEKAWRERFAQLHKKLDQDQSELDVMQREAGVAAVQYYNGDPMKAEQDQTSQQPMGAAYNKKVADIDAKKKEVDSDKQAIANAEDELHKAGGDPGWSR